LTGRISTTGEGRDHGVFRALFESAAVGLTIVDVDRRIIDCNDAYCRIIGRTRREVLESKTTDFGVPGEPDVTEDLMQQVVAGRRPSYSAEKRYMRPDGSTVPVRVNVAPIGDRRGTYVGVVLDLSEKEQAQLEVREQKALLDRAQEVGGVGSWVWYPDEGRNVWSAQARRIFGFTDEEADTEDPALFFDGVHPDDRERIASTTWAAVSTGGFVRNDFRFIRRSDGAVRWIHGQAIVDQGRVLGAVTDITEARELAQGLERQAAQLRQAQAIGRIGFWRWDPATDMTEWSDEARRIYGLDESAGAADEFWSIVHPDDVSLIQMRMEETLGRGLPLELEHRIVVRGEVRWVRTSAELEIGEHGKIRHVGIVIDTTSTRVVQDELAEQKTLLERAEAVGGTGSWAWYARADRTVWSAQALRIVGLADADAQGRDAQAFFDVIHPEDVAVRDRDTFMDAAAPKVVEYRIIRPSDGATRWIRETGLLERGIDGLPFRLLGALADITEAKASEDERRATAEALDRAHELARVGRYTVDARNRTILFSSEVAGILGAGPDDLLLGLDEFRRRFVYEEDREDWSRAAEACLAAAGEFGWSARMVSGDGRVMRVRVRGRTEADESGRPVRAVGVIQDVTEQHALEQSLLQAQKLEAVGRLAAGVAHDFNNLLTVIVGNLEFALASGAATSELNEVSRAADRASELVRQLLAFSRIDDPAETPDVIDLNDVVGNVSRMIERVLPDNISVQSSLSQGTAPVRLDPIQLEQALLNLAVNARDAMPTGGVMRIGTTTTAETVSFEVTDTGEGMNDEVLERIFDPFYTTKRPGEGTGLGLSTVYGIVTRAGGTIDVESEVGVGTTFRISLPRAEGAVAEVEAPPAPDEAHESHGGRVLLVEDNDMVRSFTAEALHQAGYDVVATANGLEALDVVAVDDEFDVVVTDMMMPSLTGVQLAAELEAQGHALPLVFTSGYPAGIVDELPESTRAEFLAKPFRGAELVSVIERLLA
jgi:PAS domain S-box-containing protein